MIRMAYFRWICIDMQLMKNLRTILHNFQFSIHSFWKPHCINVIVTDGYILISSNNLRCDDHNRKPNTQKVEAGEFPAQMASIAENVSIWWRHHGVFVNRAFRCNDQLNIHHWSDHYIEFSFERNRLIITIDFTHTAHRYV